MSAMLQSIRLRSYADSSRGECEMMTVEELIAQLQQVENKEKIVVLNTHLENALPLWKVLDAERETYIILQSDVKVKWR